MIVYAYYDPSPTAPHFQARFIRLWAQSWREHGWKPRLLTQRMAEEHPGYAPGSTQMAKAVMASSYFDEPGMLVRANMINFGLEPKRLAAGGVSFYPGCVAISRSTIRETAKTRCVHTILDYRFDIISADLAACRPVKVFSDWDADLVMECLKKWR